MALENLAKDITVGHVGVMAMEYVEEGIPFLRSLNVDPLRINLTGLKYVASEFHARLKKSALKPGDVVIVRTGKPGACAVIPESLPIANCSDLVIVRCGPELDPQFLAYYVNSQSAHHIHSHLVGAVQQHFNVGSARKLQINLPSRKEQGAIVHILGTLDDKIELNRRQNETLEAMARALFKSWFVDFDPVRAEAEERDAGLPENISKLFPDSFEDSELGEIPKGWRIGPFRDVASLSKETLNPLETPEVEFLHFSIPAYDEGKVPKKELGSGIKSLKFLVPDDCVLMSKLNPMTERVWFVDVPQEIPAVCSTEFLVLRARAPFSRPFVYSLTRSVDFRRTIQESVTGTSNSHQRTQPDTVLGILSPLPSGPVLRQFDAAVSPILKMIQTNVRESQHLAALRDTLLPKLLSGEIALPHAANLLVKDP